eukprot:c39075_g1_i1.p1 GENE.c39075_g1_i1~~c39075_g1_i1.p1  ORF type:complete len:578 (+),score=110.14 c39075_g1_i1:31-1764(+)
MVGLGLVLFVSASVSLAAAKSYCNPSQPCWPTPAEILALSEALDPGAPRFLKWDGQPHARVSAVPQGSPGDQPLFGLGVAGLRSVYTRDSASVCIFDGTEDEYCKVSVRNVPYDGITPGFVVWPLTAAHVQVAVEFAVEHNLCIMVAGTGHDFLNRHSCADGLFIRTSLMKDIEWDLTDAKGFGNLAGSVKFGAGIVFSEAQESAANHGRFVASGWATTVGVVGWSIGGGHGPMSAFAGLGVDNILEVEIVGANGTLITANATQHTDLFFALRGGGGSNWGVITAITVKAHFIPEGGFTVARLVVTNNFCDSGTASLAALVHGYVSWALALGSKFSGLFYVQAGKTDNPPDCGGGWLVTLVYVYLGNSTEPDFDGNATTIATLASSTGLVLQSDVDNYPTFFGYMQNKDLEPILPTNDLYHPSKFYDGGVPSVLVSRPVASSQLANYLISRTLECKTANRCGTREELYQDLTGNLDSFQDPNVSIHPNFRTAVFHLVSPIAPSAAATLYKLGEASYFSESSYSILDFSTRYWGPNKQRLEAIKKLYDPSNVFGCRHCVGSSPISPLVPSALVSAERD